jgi:hypothetical protein
VASSAVLVLFFSRKNSTTCFYVEALDDLLREVLPHLGHQVIVELNAGVLQQHVGLAVAVGQGALEELGAELGVLGDIALHRLGSLLPRLLLACAS